MQSTDAGRSRNSYTGWLTQGIYTGYLRKAAQLNLVPMIDIFTVLVTFLLMTAVFSRITILQLDLPSSTASTSATPPAFRPEVIVREAGFEITNGSRLIATLPKVNGEYDLQGLSALALSLKREYPEADDASVLLEQEIPYDYLIQVMDAIRSIEVPADSAPAVAATPPGSGPQSSSRKALPRTTRMLLFTRIAVGDAP